MTGDALTWRTIPVWTYVPSPANAASSRYGPVGRFGMTYDPFSSVTMVRVNPVSVCVTVTVTPGGTPPLWSFTVPLNCAVAWARAAAAASRIVNALITKVLRKRSITSPSSRWPAGFAAGNPACLHRCPVGYRGECREADPPARYFVRL